MKSTLGQNTSGKTGFQLDRDKYISSNMPDKDEYYLTTELSGHKIDKNNAISVLYKSDRVKNKVHGHKSYSL